MLSDAADVAVVSLYVMFQTLPTGKGLATSIALEWLHLQKVQHFEKMTLSIKIIVLAITVYGFI
jgi:hypothetical protein